MRRKLLPILALALAALFLAQFLVARAYLTDNFRTLDQREARANIERLLAAVAGERQALLRTAYDWARWDDTYAFLQDRNPDYFASNLTPNTLADLGLVGMLFVDIDGELVAAPALHPLTGTPLNLPPDLLALFGPEGEGFRTALHDGLYERTLGLRELPVNIAATPVLRSDESGDPRGVLVLIQYIDLGAISARVRLQEYTPDVITYHPSLIAGAQALPDPRDGTQGVYLEATPRGHTGTLLLPDLDGRPALALRLLFPNAWAAEASRQVWFYFGSSLLIAAVVMLIAVWLLHRRVIGPLETLDRQVAEIGESGSFAARLPVRRGDDEIVRLSRRINDTLSVLEDSQLALTYQAHHDPLTGLINRREFESRVGFLIENLRRKDATHALLYIDLDQFKIVNDTSGHLAGDLLLKQLSRLFAGLVRENDSLARMGGDEFTLLLQDSGEANAVKVAEKLLGALQDFRFQWEERQFRVGASIGIVLVDRDAGDFHDVLAAADSACFMAKEQGRNRYHVYRRDDRELARRNDEMQWVTRIHDALENDGFEFHYQLIAPADPDQLGEFKFELLLRMRSEEGLIGPARFIPAAERYRLMPSIDRWVLQRVCDDLFPLLLHEGVICCVNLSGQSIGEDDFESFLIERMQRRNELAHHLCFEITETAAIGNLQQARRLIERLRNLGCRFALDDFGSGLSSFRYLKNLKVDYLKIDGSFVTGMIEDPLDHAMVESFHDVGRLLGLRTVAEFVENEQTRAALQRIGIDSVQGYGVGGGVKPLDRLRADLEVFLFRRRNRGAHPAVSP